MRTAPILTDVVAVSDCWLKAKTLSRPTAVPKSQNNKMSSTEATTIFCFEVLVVFYLFTIFSTATASYKASDGLGKIKKDSQE
jgi:hypothetical protein